MTANRLARQKKGRSGDGNRNEKSELFNQRDRNARMRKESKLAQKEAEKQSESGSEERKRQHSL